MSDKQVNAAGLLCCLLEQSEPSCNGAALLGGEYGDGGDELIRERLLVIGKELAYVTCPDCEIEMARFVRAAGKTTVIFYCDECGEVEATRDRLKTYAVSLSKLVDRLANSLDLPNSRRKEIRGDFSWRLGVQEPQRGKAKTWYFARNLNDPAVAKELLEQIRADNAVRSAIIITSTDVPLPSGSPLADYEVKNLAAVARLSQNRFLFFDDRVEIQNAEPQDDVKLGTSLRFARKKGLAYIDGVKYALEPMQQKILLALMDAHAHRLEGGQIGSRCGSDAFPFKPIKFFGRNMEVYKTFIQYVRGDKMYELMIPTGDKGLL